MIDFREIRHFHLYCGLGGGAKGFNKAKAALGNLHARFRCIGGVDCDAAAIRDFGRLTGVAGTVLDMFSREQYATFHGRQPPAEWREATPADIFRAAGCEYPHIVFLSAPCKGFSGLLSETMSLSAKYQALNELTLRGIWLMLEAFKDDLPEFVLFENVPRIQTRGRKLLDRIVALLQAYGYAVAETTHDCGQLGGLGQSRKRFLLVARNVAKVPPFLYEPRMKPLRSVGDVLGRLPLPGDSRGGAMHRLPQLQWKTWVRLAFVEAGKDWRSLQRLAVEDGVLRDYALVPAAAYHNGALGVNAWDEAAGVVTGNGRPHSGNFAVADPRFDARGNDFAQYGVRDWGGTSGAVINVKAPGQGTFSVADPRVGIERPLFSHAYRVARFDTAAPAVHGPGGAGGMAVADPRQPGELFAKYQVTKFDEPTGTVISGSTTGQGAFAVADPRPGLDRQQGDAYRTAGHYGVVPWDRAAYAVTGSLQHDSGRGNVADPRMPPADAKLVAVIIAEDGTWHRPFTTLDMAALQSLVDGEELLELDGLSDSAWRERIGNAVPPDAAEAIGGVMGRTLLLAWSGETFVLDSSPIWVRPIVAAIQCGSAA